MGRSLTYRRHLESLRKKLTSRVALLRRLDGSGWGARATTLRIANLALVHSTAEYCAPGWCRNVYTRLIHPAINEALRIVTGCLRHAPEDNLPILAVIQLAELRRNGATLFLARPAVESGHLLHSALTCPPGANIRRLKSRLPFVLAAQQLISSSDSNNIRTAHWADHQMKAEWLDNLTRLRTFIPDTGTHPPGMALPRTAWVRLNRLLTFGHFRSCLHKWGMASSAAFECDAKEQTIDHVVLQCPAHRPPRGLHGMTVLDDETIEWLLNTCPELFFFGDLSVIGQNVFEMTKKIKSFRPVCLKI